MADMPPLRMPQPDGGKLHINVPIGILSSLGFLLVQLVGVVIWAANEHAQRIELQHNFDDFKVSMRERAVSIDRALERLDTSGSRALALVADRQVTNVTRANLIEDRISSTVTRLDVQGAALGRIDQRLENIDHRLDELEKQHPPPKAP
jgi:hypothetical protein